MSGVKANSFILLNINKSAFKITITRTSFNLDVTKSGQNQTIKSVQFGLCFDMIKGSAHNVHPYANFEYQQNSVQFKGAEILILILSI